MPLCVLVKANKRQRHVFALFLHNPALSKPLYFLQKPTKTKTFCTKFPATQSSRYTLTQPKMGTLADWLQPDSHFCLHSRLLVFSTSSVRGPLEGCRTEVLQGCRKLTWMRSDFAKRMLKGGFIWFCHFLTLHFFLEILPISVFHRNVDSFWYCLISNIFIVKTNKWTNIFRLLSNRDTCTANASWQNVGVEFFLFPLLLNVSRFLSRAA